MRWSQSQISMQTTWFLIRYTPHCCSVCFLHTVYFLIVKPLLQEINLFKSYFLVSYRGILCISFTQISYLFPESNNLCEIIPSSQHNGDHISLSLCVVSSITQSISSHQAVQRSAETMSQCGIKTAWEHVERTKKSARERMNSAVCGRAYPQLLPWCRHCGCSSSHNLKLEFQLSYCAHK